MRAVAIKALNGAEEHPINDITQFNTYAAPAMAELKSHHKRTKKKKKTLNNTTRKTKRQIPLNTQLVNGNKIS